MKFLVSKSSHLAGEVTIPGNKSGTARALAIAAVADGVSEIVNPLHNLDSYSIANMLELLGAKMDFSDDSCWKVHGTSGQLKQPDNVLDAGNSGTGFYTVAALASTVAGTSVISGDYQICYRPAGPEIDALNRMGVKVFSTRNNGCAPLVITGPFIGGKASFADYNSQWFSPGIFIAAALSKEGAEIFVDGDPQEKPYVDMSIGMMEQAGLHVVNEDYHHYIIEGGQKAHAARFVIPADWGSAGYPMVATAITNSTATFKGLDKDTYAGEVEYMDILRKTGCKVEYHNGDVTITGSDCLEGIEVNCSRIPDSIPALMALGCACKKGRMVLRNIVAEYYKETNRPHTMAIELAKMGAKIEEGDNCVTIYPSQLRGALIDGHHDHRIVMATSVAALAAEGITIVDHSEFTAVSYPEFYDHMRALGANIQRITEA